MFLPNYRDSSIVNLMSSLLHAFEGTSDYAPLALLPASSLSDTRNVILMVFDGFGYEFLLKQESGSIFHKNLRGKMTSVFPSTTAAGVTTFLTGLAPQQHAVTGWFMHLKELGGVATTLRFRPRCCDASLRRDGVRPDILYGNYANSFRQIRRHTYSLQHKELSDTDYTTSMNPFSEKIPFTSFYGCLRQIQTIITSHDERKFILAYWDGIDARSHDCGTESLEVIRHYYELAEGIASLVKALVDTDTTLIITADHGLIDTEPSKTIQVKHHPGLRETLILPLCGEPRVAYCYVRPSKIEQFEEYVEQHFTGMGELYRSEKLIHKGWFGLFEPDLRLSERIGDYVLIMRENYVIRDFLLGEEENFHKADHGGVSKEEMFVPLIVIQL
jgi:predicted AlkP superfamily pyrophosphatase or phosphodiesterase